MIATQLETGIHVCIDIVWKRNDILHIYHHLNAIVWNELGTSYIQ